MTGREICPGVQMYKPKRYIKVSRNSGAETIKGQLIRKGTAELWNSAADMPMC